MTTDEARAARDAALLAWWAAGPASLSAESDAAWAAYKAAGARALLLEADPELAAAYEGAGQLAEVA